MLGPDEQFTQLSLSGGKPKKPNIIKSLCLLLGPDFCTDIITVETADHARLSLQLSYNWHFDMKDKKDIMESAKIFSVPDFVGDACKAIASRVRGAVAQVQFDDFHKVCFQKLSSSLFRCLFSVITLIMMYVILFCRILQGSLDHLYLDLMTRRKFEINSNFPRTICVLQALTFNL